MSLSKFSHSKNRPHRKLIESLYVHNFFECQFSSTRTIESQNTWLSNILSFWFFTLSGQFSLLQEMTKFPEFFVKYLNFLNLHCLHSLNRFESLSKPDGPSQIDFVDRQVNWPQTYLEQIILTLIFHIWENDASFPLEPVEQCTSCSLLFLFYSCLSGLPTELGGCFPLYFVFSIHSGMKMRQIFFTTFFCRYLVCSSTGNSSVEATILQACTVRGSWPACSELQTWRSSALNRNFLI